MMRLVALGGLALVDATGPVAGSAGRGRNLGLLVLLARAGEAGLTRDRIAALLWPESDEARARHSLDQALYTLRRTLGGEVFRAGGSTLALNARVLPSDVAEVVAAAAAGDDETVIDRYGGPFLDGFHLPAAPEFESWVATERSGLHGVYVAALESLALCAAEAGDHATAVARWRALAAAEPLSSRVARGLMEALEAAGDRAGAIEAARIHAALVEEQLDTAPDPSLVEYERALRRAPPPTLPPASTEAPAVPPEARADPPGPTARPRRPRGRWVAVVASVGIVVTGALVVHDTAAPDPPGSRPTVAVTPFENETGDPTLASLGPMAADWITEGLVRTGIVDVLAPERGAAHTLVTGRVYRSADSIWLQARVSASEEGRVLRVSDPVGAPISEPSRALEPLRQQVLGALATLYDPRLTAWARSALRPPRYEAFQELAAGLELFAEPRDLVGASERFASAARLDPDYALPRLWLAWTSLMRGSWAQADSIVRALSASRDAMSPVERAWHDRITAVLDGDNERSFRAARRMVDVAPRSGWTIALASAALDVHRPGVAVSALSEGGIERLGLEAGFGWFLLTEALHQEGDYAAELEAAEEGVRSTGLDWGYLGPGISALAALGRIDELERRLDALQGRPPLDDGVPRGLAVLSAAFLELRAHGRREAADALLEHRLARVFDVSTRADPGRWARMRLLYEAGHVEEARVLQRALPADAARTLHYRAMSALLAARGGDDATARAVDAELSEIDRPWLFGEPTLWRAHIHAVLGDDDALDLLRAAFAEGQGAQAWHDVHVSRDFDALRRSPAFEAWARPR